MKEKLILNVEWIHPSRTSIRQTMISAKDVEKRLEGINKSIAELAKTDKVEINISVHRTEPTND